MLASNPEAEVHCPNCEWQLLKVEDKVCPEDINVVERRIYCKSCDAENVIRINLNLHEGR